jgi:hypothetical protein
MRPGPESTLSLTGAERSFPGVRERVSNQGDYSTMESNKQTYQSPHQKMHALKYSERDAISHHLCNYLVVKCPLILSFSLHRSLMIQ